MNKLLVGIVTVILCLSGIVISGAAPRTIIGMGGECDPTVYAGCTSIPLTLGILCDGGAGELDCPQFFAPDVSDTTGSRFYGMNQLAQPSCVQSLDVGVTWTTCPSQPFTTQDGGSQAYFGLSRTGAIMIAANTAANTCEIKRSIDGGINWSTVYTEATLIDCGNATEATSDLMKCSQVSDYCVMLGGDLSVFFNKIPLESLNNGASWTPGTSLAFAGFNGAQPVIDISMVNDNMYAVGTNMRSTGRASTRTSGSSYLVTGLWTGMTVGDVAAPGSGALIMGGNFYCVCSQIDVGALIPMNLRNGLDGTIIRSFFMEDMGYKENAPTFIAISPFSSVAYIMSLRRGTSDYSVWLTQDGFATNPLKLGNHTPANVFIGCCRGDVYYYGGRIYWSSGGAGGDSQFFRIS